MLGTPIWPDMRVPGPRLKNPGAIPDCGSELYSVDEWLDDCKTSFIYMYLRLLVL